MSRARVAALTAAAATAAVVLSSCSAFSGDDPALSASPLPSATDSPEATPSGLDAFYGQKISWRDCRDGARCGTLTVPLDYDHPEGTTIKLSVLKVPATSDDQRIGSLVVNPGGPGGSGVNYAANAEAYFGSEVRAAFDIVGVDPRGVGESTPIDCLDDSTLDAYIASDPDPDTTAEAQSAEQDLARFGQGCLDKSGDLTRHMSTVEAAKDMDVLRAALGQDKLAYFGASYGTFLGATYAGLFPERVGRMVLDGAIDPALDQVRTSLVQAHGFEVALRAYVQDCVDKGSCYLGRTVDEGIGRIQEFLAQLDRAPLPGDGKRVLTEGLGVLGIWAPLYDKKSWPALDVALGQAFNGQGATLLTFADAYTGRGPDGFTDNSTEALYAVNCLDHDESIPLDQVQRYERRFAKASPTFGRIFAFGLTACGAWPVHTGKGPAAITAAGAAPILVVGTTRDPATPLAWAQSLAAQLDSGVLLTRDGDGHTGYRAGNSCVDDTIEKYLVSGVVPDGDVTC